MQMPVRAAPDGGGDGDDFEMSGERRPGFDISEGLTASSTARVALSRCLMFRRL